MSKINRIRIINLNYNNDTMKIDDEIFDLSGQSTLLSLRNGGGKTVLVQMIISLFVNSSYRNFENRPFQSYFRTNRPTFIMTEWLLDHGAGYLLVGMMVRKNQNPEEDGADLEIHTFIGSYKQSCPYLIDQIPIIEVKGERRILKGYGVCKKEFEELRQDRNHDFDYYDMNSYHQRKRYFNRLREYQINSKEWEGIIKKINLKESGLSELFNNAKDEKGLIENWFIDAVNKKLNEEHDRIKEFERLAKNLVRQYRDNQANIEKKQIIEHYFTDVERIRVNLAEYKRAEEDLRKQQGVIADFHMQMNMLLDQTQQLIGEYEQKIQAFQAEILGIKYEKFSYGIYQEMRKKQECVNRRIEEETNLTYIQKERQDTEQRLHLIQCARMYQEMMDFKREMEELQAQIDAVMSEQKDHEAEVNELGGGLKAFYQELISEVTELLHAVTEELQGLEEELAQTIAAREQTEQRKEQLLVEKTRLDTQVHFFDQKETEFHQSYGSKLQRNILGAYDDGELGVINQQYHDEELALTNRRDEIQKEQKQLAKEKEQLEADRERLSAEVRKAQEQIERWKKTCTELKVQKEARLTILNYLELSADDVDDRGRILDTIDRKLGQLELDKSALLIEENHLRKEYDDLRQGRLLELPQNVVEYFEQLGIRYIYGMEWLKKNQRSVLENEEFVRKNPFIPYSIILEEEDYQTLANGDREVYTSFPIPIVRRSVLNETFESRSNLTEIGKISFFVMFNRHLIDEEKLAAMLTDKERELAGVAERLETKNSDIRIYQGHRHTIEEQEYSESVLKRGIEQQEMAEHQLEIAQKESAAVQQAIRENRDRMEENHRNSESIALDLQRASQKLAAFEKLTTAYQEYLINLRLSLAKQEEIKTAQKQLLELKHAAAHIQSQIEIKKEESRQLGSRLEDTNDEAAEYSRFDARAVEMDSLQLKSRYDALTKKLDTNISFLQEQYEKASRRYDKKRSALENSCKEQFHDEQLRMVIVVDQEEDNLKVSLASIRKKESDVYNRITKLGGDIERADEKITTERARMQEEVGESEPMDAELIRDTDFAARQKIAEYEVQKLESHRAQKNREKEIYFAICTTFDEYKELEPLEGETYPAIDTIADLREYSAQLRSHLNHLEKERENQRTGTLELIREIAAYARYQDDYFRKSFQNLITASDQAAQLERQMNMQNQVYTNQLERLKVDLENIEKERLSIEDIFMDYVFSVDENIKKIDQNSTITVRERNLKMLRIITPEWEDNKEHYRLRLHDFIEELIHRGLKAIAANENLDELLGKYITTQRIYDAVVGIGNIQIKMYKIEAEREVLISWREVSANSGGEGFLSAFIILTCLLSYMRKDDADVFAKGEEGKVLIMDNPFAQTNASHLLKPLMEMAKRTNTQLICLSGLGGDSIYNRFDNIYVIKLEKSSIHTGLQYMSLDHIKGDAVPYEIKKMHTSEFKVEQMSLFEME